MNVSHLHNVFMLGTLVQFKYVQTISPPNSKNFVVGMAGGYEVFGDAKEYDDFLAKYIKWLEMGSDKKKDREYL